MVPLGSLGMGAIAQSLGVRGAIGLGGLGCLVCGLAAVVVAQRAAGTFAVVRQPESVVG